MWPFTWINRKNKRKLEELKARFRRGLEGDQEALRSDWEKIVKW